MVCTSPRCGEHESGYAVASKMMLLKTKIRQLMERMVRSGVPPMPAGMSLGVSASTVGKWINCGMGFLENNPKRPTNASAIMTVDKESVTEGEWYRHEVECMELAKAVVATEGKLVSGLVKRMWKSSSKNPDMMKFLFKQYTHAHGLSEENKTAKETDTAQDHSAAVTVYLPDNGRLIVKKPA